jgi:hypothetical protein
MAPSPELVAAANVADKLARVKVLDAAQDTVCGALEIANVFTDVMASYVSVAVTEAVTPHEPS